MVVSLHRSPRRALYSQRAQSSSVWLLGAETAPRVTGKLTSRLAGRQGPIADGMQRAWRVREGAEGVYQEGQAWVTSFSDCFTLSMGGGWWCLAHSHSSFSRSFLELPLLVHLGKFPVHGGLAALHLGEPLPHGMHSAQLAFEGLPGLLGAQFYRGLELSPSISQSVKWVQSAFPQV